VSLGTNGLSQGTQANRAADIRLFNDGSYRLDIGTQTGGGAFSSGPTVTSSNNFGESGTTFNTHTLDIFAYAGTTGGATLGYTGPDSNAHILDPHSFAVYIDGTLLQPTNNFTANGAYGFENSSFYSQGTLGRLGLVTGGASAVSGMDFLVDNIQLSAIPEPSTFVLLGAGGLRTFWRVILPLSLPGVVTAVVLPLTSGRPVPAGSVTFVVDDAPMKVSAKLDKHGRAKGTVTLQKEGVHKIRADFKPSAGSKVCHPSSSPNLLHTVTKGQVPTRGSGPVAGHPPMAAKKKKPSPPKGRGSTHEKDSDNDRGHKGAKKKKSFVRAEAQRRGGVARATAFCAKRSEW